MLNNQENRDFDALYRAHYDFVWRSAQRLGVAPAEVEDVLQETFVIAYRRIGEFEARSKTSTWLYGILDNVRRNHQRSQFRGQRKVHALARERERELLDTARRETTQLDAERMLAIQLLEDFLHELDESKREVFILAELEGMTRREIAAALDINVNTVQSRLRVARAEFERSFGHDRAVVRLCASLCEQPARASKRSLQRTRALIVAALEPSVPLDASAGQLVLPLRASAGQLVLAKLLSGWGALALALTVASLVVLRVRQQPRPDPRAGRSVNAARDTFEGTKPVLETSAAEASTPEEPPIVVSSSDAGTTPGPRRPSPRSRSDATQAQGQGQAPAAGIPRPSPSESGYDAFKAAREALIRDEPAEALRLVGTLDRSGELGWERTVTEVAALCRLGRIVAAREAAARWNSGDDSREVVAPCE